MFLMILMMVGCSAPTIATTTPITTAIATMVETVPASMPSTTVATAPATKPTTTAVPTGEELAQDILAILKEGYGSMFDVELADKQFKLRPFGESFLKDFNEANTGKKSNIDALNSFANGLADVTDSFPRDIKEYQVSVINPLNVKNVLFVIKNGEVEYNYLDEIVVDNVSSSDSEMSETEQMVFDLFEKIYGKDYNIRLEDTAYYLDPENETIIQGMELAMQGQKVGLDFWKQLKDNFNVISTNLPTELKEYTIQITNPLDKTKILFVSQEGETFYDAFKE